MAKKAQQMLTKNSATVISLNDFPRLGSSYLEAPGLYIAIYKHSNVLCKYNVAWLTIHICGLGNTGASFYTSWKQCICFEFEGIKHEQYEKRKFLKS